MRTLDLDQYWPTPLTMPKGKGDDTLAATADPLITSSSGGALAVEGSAPEQPVLEQIPQPVPRLRKPWRAKLAARVSSGADRSRRLLRGFDAAAAAWASIGFVAGMVAWHAIGFWGFVHTAVLNSGSRTTEAASASASVNSPQRRVVFKEVLTTGSLATFSPELSACVALAADRTSGVTQAQPCSGDIAPMRDAGKRRKAARLEGVEARLQKPEAWSATTQESVSASAAPASETLAEKDFDLTLTAAQSTATR